GAQPAGKTAAGPGQPNSVPQHVCGPPRAGFARCHAIVWLSAKPTKRSSTTSTTAPTTTSSTTAPTTTTSTSTTTSTTTSSTTTTSTTTSSTTTSSTTTSTSPTTTSTTVPSTTTTVPGSCAYTPAAGPQPSGYAPCDLQSAYNLPSSTASAS